MRPFKYGSVCRWRIRAPLEKKNDKINQFFLLFGMSFLQKQGLLRQGISYEDYDGELVTSIVNGEECVFTFLMNGMQMCYRPAYLEGRISV